MNEKATSQEVDSNVSREGFCVCSAFEQLGSYGLVPYWMDFLVNHRSSTVQQCSVANSVQLSGQELDSLAQQQCATANNEEIEAAGANNHSHWVSGRGGKCSVPLSTNYALHMRTALPRCVLRCAAFPYTENDSTLQPYRCQAS